MCRVYHGKNGNYIRLCSATGRKGVHVPIDDSVKWGASRHVLLSHRERNEFTERIKEPPNHKCAICGTPAISKHEKICEPCKKAPKVNHGYRNSVFNDGIIGVD